MVNNSNKRTLTIECDEWAQAFAKSCASQGKAYKFYALKPDPNLTPGVALGLFTDSGGKVFQPDPHWAWHIAVETGGLLHDEVHPNGVPIQKYISYFAYSDVISVQSFSDLQMAIAWAEQ